MSKQAVTYVTAPRILRAIYVSEPGLYDIDGVPFEASATEVGRYYSVADARLGIKHVLSHSKVHFERTWQLPEQD